MPLEVPVLYTRLVFCDTLYRGGFLGIREPLRGHRIVRHQNDGKYSDHDCQDAKCDEHDSPSRDMFPGDLLETLRYVKHFE